MLGRSHVIKDEQKVCGRRLVGGLAHAREADAGGGQTDRGDAECDFSHIATKRLTELLHVHLPLVSKLDALNQMTSYARCLFLASLSAECKIYSTHAYYIL